MRDPRRILVVSGARALSRTPAARLWALREILLRLDPHTVVAHGDCYEGPDVWGWSLARIGCLPQVCFPARAAPYITERDGSVRPLRGDFKYSSPLERNDVLARWAGGQLRMGRDVRAITLRCDWPLVDGERATQGTAYTRDRLVEALGAERVTDLVCPAQFGPSEVVYMHATEANPRRGVVDYDARKGNARG